MGTRSTRATASGIAVVAGLAAGAHGQMFHHVDGTARNDVPFDIVETDDGGYATAGYVEDFNPFTGASDRDFYVVKHRADGTVSWATRFGGQGRDEAYSIEQTGDGGYIVAGQTDSVGPTLQLALLRLDPSGKPVWDNAFRSDAFGELINPMEAGYHPEVSVIESFNGDFVAVSNARTAAGNQLGVMLRVDPTGGLVFNNAYYDSANPQLTFVTFTDVQELTPVDEDFDGVPDRADLAITGYTTRIVDPAGDGQIFLGPQNMLAMRVKPNGSQVWAGEYYTGQADGPSNEEGYGIDVGPSDDGSDLLVVGANQDFGTQTTFSTHHFWLDAGGGAILTNHVTFGLLPSQAATRFTFKGLGYEVVTGGADDGLIPSPTGTSAAVLVSPGFGSGGPKVGWLGTYTDLQTDYPDRFEGVALPAQACGFAFTTPEIPRGGVGGTDNYMVKTNDAGETACLYTLIEAEQDRPQVGSVSRRFEFVDDDEFTKWGAERDIERRDYSVCYDSDCTVGCAADLNGDGVLNNTDINLFVSLFLAMNAAADLNNDGNFNNTDINLFVSLFLNGC